MCACSQKEYTHCGRACVGRYIGEISQNYHLDKLVFVDGSAMSMHQPTMRRNRGSVMWGSVLLKRHPHLWNTACPLPYLLPRCRAPRVNKKSRVYSKLCWRIANGCITVVSSIFYPPCSGMIGSSQQRKIHSSLSHYNDGCTNKAKAMGW